MHSYMAKYVCDGNKLLLQKGNTQSRKQEELRKRASPFHLNKGVSDI